jgi:hypothetical protein
MEKSPGEKYWKILSFEEKEELLKSSDFFDGFSNHLWSYLPIVIKDYIENRKNKSDNNES